jgi:hypothetical protein
MGRPIIYPCGRRVVSTNGRRLFRAQQGAPLPRESTKSSRGLRKRPPQEKTINKQSRTENQLTVSEKEALLKLQGVNPDRPYQYQLGLALDKFVEMRNLVIKDRKLKPFNPVSDPIGTGSPKAIELYIELPNVSDDDKKLNQCFRSALYKAFGKAKIERHRVESEEGIEDEPSILNWPIQLEMISNGHIKGQGHLKFYRKGECIRFEIRAESPSIAKYETKEQGIKARSGTLSKREKISFISGFLDEAINGIVRHVNRELESIPVTSLGKVLAKKIMQRSRDLLPTVANTVKYSKVVDYIAQYGFIDQKEFVKYANPQGLKKLSCHEHGFLVKRSKGIEGLTPDIAQGRIRNASYDLAMDRLEFNGRCTCTLVAGQIKSLGQKLKETVEGWNIGSERYSLKSHVAGHGLSQDLWKMIYDAAGSASSHEGGTSSIVIKRGVA